MGRLYFDETNDDLCSELTPRSFQVGSEKEITPFFIARRGKCSFVQKVRNMEKMGVAVAIIVDNLDENVQHIIMKDDGTGNSIGIPAMLIDKEEGEKLIDFITN